jgi:hypothetical protein
MNRLRIGLLAATCASTVLLASPSALAGLKTFGDVSINDSAMVASGELGAARSTTDTRQYLSCQTAADTGSSLGQCFAVDANGVFRSCYTFNPQLVATIRSLNGDSYLVFDWNANGECTGVIVYNGSDTPPKAP